VFHEGREFREIKELSSSPGVMILKGHSAVALDPDSQLITLDDDRIVHYGKVLVATGGKPKRY
jgi:NAD(P)H-nitrite reductase large subunit